MKRKTSLAVLLCLLSGFVLVGCSPADNSTTTSTNAPPATAPSTNK